MMFTDDKPHRRYAESHGVVFWNGNTASNEEEATRGVVYLGAPGMPYPEFEFKLPEERVAMQQLEMALAKAFTKGTLAAKREIRAVLGVTEPRH